MRETWRIVPSLPDYMVSTEGRIMRVPFMGPMPHGGERHYEGVPYPGVWDGDRYIFTYKGKTYKVHRLVCEAFHGAAPFDRAVVMHMDENSRNNRPSNLKWGTQKENLNAPGFLAYCRSRVGNDNPANKGRAKKAAA